MGPSRGPVPSLTLHVTPRTKNHPSPLPWYVASAGIERALPQEDFDRCLATWTGQRSVRVVIICRRVQSECAAPLDYRYRYHHDPEDAGIGPKLRASSLKNPMEGGFGNESDRNHVVPLVFCIAEARCVSDTSRSFAHAYHKERVPQRFQEYANSASTAWDQTMSICDLPQWLVMAGKEGKLANAADNSRTSPSHEGMAKQDQERFPTKPSQVSPAP